jgi:sterol desaturase/sphingolipid hydroxylase (fatty acid hydroxylase superfamily)
MSLVLLAAVLTAVALCERAQRLRFEPQRFLRSHFATDLVYLATGGLALSLAMRTGAARLAADWGTALPALASLPALAVVPLAVVLHDLFAYLAHAWMHRSDRLWRLHKVHHSSPALDWLATFRAHPLEHALRHLFSPVALLLLGFPLYAVAVSSTVYTAWAVLNHANLDLGSRFAEALLITPRLHRLHHVPDSAQRNLGTIFSLWDRLRGTLVVDRAAPTRPLGVPGELDSYPQTWIRQLVEPIRSEAAPKARSVSLMRAEITARERSR